MIPSFYPTWATTPYGVETNVLDSPQPEHFGTRTTPAGAAKWT